MNRLFAVFSALILLALAGCSSLPSQEPVAFTGGAEYFTSGKVAVVSTQVPDSDTTFPGADCLLCAAAAAASNSDLTTQVRTFSNDDIAALPKELLQLLKAKGKSSVLVETPLVLKELPKYKSDIPNSTERDFGQLAQQYGASEILVLDWRGLGAIRTYSNGYFPQGGPRGYVRGYAYLVDAKTNTYKWFQPLKTEIHVEGEWDEPKQFPGVTNAYYQAVEETRDAVLAPFKSK